MYDLLIGYNLIISNNLFTVLLYAPITFNIKINLYGAKFSSVLKLIKILKLKIINFIKHFINNLIYI